MWRGIRIATAVAVAVLWTGLTSQRVALWTSERALWANAVAHAPLKPRPWVNLGKQYALEGADRLAADAYETGIRLTQAPLRSREEQIVGRAVGEMNLALLRLETGDVHAALTLASQAAARVPSSPSIQQMALWIAAHRSPE